MEYHLEEPNRKKKIQASLRSQVGYSPIGFVRCGRAACRVSALKWKMGKETGGKKMEDVWEFGTKSNALCSLVLRLFRS